MKSGFALVKSSIESYPQVMAIIFTLKRSTRGYFRGGNGFIIGIVRRNIGSNGGGDSLSCF